MSEEDFEDEQSEEEESEFDEDASADEGSEMDEDASGEDWSELEEEGTPKERTGSNMVAARADKRKANGSEERPAKRRK